jgi:hypothetical protein
MQEKRDGRNDFDFLVGQWKSVQRRLRERLVGCTDWEVFEADLTMRKILNGLGNIDKVTMHREAGVALGFTLRLYNPETCEWSIYWASDAGANNIFPPMIGKFENGVGHFYAYEPIQGQHIYTRFIWTVINENECQWEQAFSTDAGQTWETNWINVFTREE